MIVVPFPRRSFPCIGQRGRREDQDPLDAAAEQQLGEDEAGLDGGQWRLAFAGLDYDAWYEWDIDLWFEKGGLSPQVTALRTLLQRDLWTPEADGVEPPLLKAIRDTRKGQAKLSEVLGERVHEAVEILIRAQGDALSSLVRSDEVQEYIEYPGRRRRRPRA